MYVPMYSIVESKVSLAGGTVKLRFTFHFSSPFHSRSKPAGRDFGKGGGEVALPHAQQLRVLDMLDFIY